MDEQLRARALQAFDAYEESFDTAKLRRPPAFMVWCAAIDWYRHRIQIVAPSADANKVQE